MFLNNVGGFYGNNPMWGQIHGNQVPYNYGWNQVPVQFYGYGNNLPFTGQPMNVPFGTQQIGGFNNGVVPFGTQQIGGFNNGVVPFGTQQIGGFNNGTVPFGTQQIGGFNHGIVPTYNTVPFTNPLFGAGLQAQMIGRGVTPFGGNFGNPFTGC